MDAYQNLEVILGLADMSNLGGLSERDGRALRKVVQNTITTKNLEIARL
jgi:hypothetical protein